MVDPGAQCPHCHVFEVPLAGELYSNRNLGKTAMLFTFGIAVPMPWGNMKFIEVFLLAVHVTFDFNLVSSDDWRPFFCWHLMCLGPRVYRCGGFRFTDPQGKKTRKQLPLGQFRP